MKTGQRQTWARRLVDGAFARRRRFKWRRGATVELFSDELLQRGWVDHVRERDGTIRGIENGLASLRLKGDS